MLNIIKLGGITSFRPLLTPNAVLHHFAINLNGCPSQLWHCGGAWSSLSSTTLRNPYHVLGIRKTASPNEVKRAYFELAKQCHPDVYEGDDAARRFQELGEAYALLTDESHAAMGPRDLSKSIFENILRDRRMHDRNVAMSEQALYAVMEMKKGNDGPTRDFVFEYRVPPQHVLPRKPLLESGLTSKTPQQGAQYSQDAEDEVVSIDVFVSNAPYQG